MIESSPFLLAVAAVCLALYVAHRLTRDVLHVSLRCGEPMPADLRPSRRSVYPCTRRPLHDGAHEHRMADSLHGTRWAR